MGVGWGWGRQVLKGARFELALEEEEWNSTKCMGGGGAEGPGWKVLGEVAGDKLGMCAEVTTCILTQF